MKAKYVLNQAFILQSEIRIKQEQISTMQDSLMNIAASLDKEKVSKTPETSPMERDITQLMQLEEELKAEIAHLAAVEQQIMEIINRIDDVKARAVLSKHYLGFKSWPDIADELDISKKWALNLHTKGMQQIERLLAEQDVPVEMEGSLCGFNQK